MLITLAGATVPRLAQGAASTPEIVCAAYARISRSPRPVHELRARAAEDLAGARAFIERIVHHLGHESVAEHAVFNLDLIGVSRLVTEIVEHSRLASYTERSQRYVRIGGDFLIPREARESGFSAAFRALARDQHTLYRKAAARMAASGESRAGKEDARYALGLATTTQLGLTVNARALASMLERLDGDALYESRMLAGRIRTLVSKIAPSLVTETREEADVVRADSGSVGHPWTGSGSNEPTLLWHTPDPARVLRETRAFCAAPTDGCALTCNVSGRKSNPSLPRAFEAVQLAFHLVMSAAAFAQLKRHRMATVLTRPYDPALGLTIPPSLAAIGMAADLESLGHQSEELALAIKGQHPAAAAYALLNAHRREVVLILNARAFHQLAMLRLDRHAQWDIRQHVRRMTDRIWADLPELAIAMGLPEMPQGS